MFWCGRLNSREIVVPLERRRHRLQLLQAHDIVDVLWVAALYRIHRGPCQRGFDPQDRRRVRFSFDFTLARQHKDFLQVVMILVAHFGELGVVGQVVVATAHGKATLVDPCNHERGVVEVDD